ncbi:protein BNIP5 [Rhynchocyon petersi]
METSQGLKKTLPNRRAKSLDRSQGPRKNLGSQDSQRFSLQTTPSKKMLHQMASNEARCSESPAQPVEAQDTMDDALSPEEIEFFPCEQRVPQDTKKDKANRRAQSGWLKTLLNFLLRTNPEEPKEKASRKSKAKEGFSQPVESPVSSCDPTIRKKSNDKRTRRRKDFGHKKCVTEETKGAFDEEAAGQEAKMATLYPEEDDLGPDRRGGDDLDFHEPLFTEGGCAGVEDGSSQARGHQPEREQEPDKDAIIQMIVELLQKVGDQWEEERLKSQRPGVILPNLGPVHKKRCSEKKSNLRRAFSHKKCGFEEPKRLGAADVPTPEARPPKRSSFLPLCVSGQRPSVSSSSDLEEPQVPEALSTDVRGLGPLETPTGAGSQGPEEELPEKRALEFNEFIQKICALLQDAEEQTAEKRRQTHQPEAAAETLVPAVRKKPPEKKSSLRRAFSYKKHNSKEAKKVGAADTSSPEVSRPPKRPSFLPLCVGGNRPSISDSLDLQDGDFQKPSPAEGGANGSLEPSSQTRKHKLEGEPQTGDRDSKELIIQKLVALLQQMNGQLGEQIRRHPSFKMFLYKLSDSSLRKLAVTLQNQEAHPPEPTTNLDERRYRFAADLVNIFAGNNGHTVHRFMGLRGHYSQNAFAQLICMNTQQVRASGNNLAVWHK